MYFDTRIYLYTMKYNLLVFKYLLDKYHAIMTIVYDAVIITKSVYIPYYLIHLSLLHMFGYK